MEIDFSPLNKKETKASNGIQTFKFKTDYSEKASYYLPARFPQEVLSRITDTVAQAFNALNLRDITRFDVRVDHAGVPYILEANAIVGLEPHHSDFPRIYQFLGKTYDDLINDILNAALERLKRNERVNY
jgi:D-alanine-D-alanine ligase